MGDERRSGEHPDTPPGLTWHPDPTQPSVPSGAHARITANIAAIHTLRTLQTEQRPATHTEQERLSRWSSWGAVPGVFDESITEFTAARAQLRELLSEREFNAASRTTINAHYTDPAIVAAMWSGLQGLGFDGGAVLEPGSGSGTFLGLAPATATLTGVELDPTTAAIAGYLYPETTIRAESFADTRLPEAHFDAVIGNVPFANVTLTDPVHNQGHHSMHNHFILKSLALTKPGGTVMVLTSRYTMDAQNPAARREIAEQAQLLGAVRLPTGAHQRTAGTQVVTDLLVLRRRDGTDTGPEADNSGQAEFSPGGPSYPATATPLGYRPAVPPTNAGWAVAASVLFFPVAFSAWTAALNVTRLWVMDDFYGAQAASDKAKRLGKIALGIGVTIFVLYFAFIITIVAVGVSTAPTRTR